jgi:phosphatidylglycerophosphate synthase
MFDDWLRRLRDRLLTPWLRRVSPAVRPNVISLLAFMLGGGAAAAAWQRRYGLALSLWLANRALDGIDGTLARVQGTQTDFGGYLDILLDFGVYALIPIGLVVGAPTPGAWLAVLAMLAAFYINAASWMYLGTILERRSAATAARNDRTTVTMPPGLIAGAETLVLYTMFIVFPGRLAALFALTAALVVLTIVQRLIWAARAL